MTVKNNSVENQTRKGKLFMVVLQEKIPSIGLWLAVLGSLIFALSEACAKLISLDVSAEVIISVRYIIHGFASSPFLFKSSKKLTGITYTEWLFCLAGGLATGATSYVANYSYHYIPLLDSFVLTNAQPIIAAVISWFWLKEKITFSDFGVILLTLVGVVIACQPTFIFGTEIDTIDPTSRTIGSVLGLSTALFMAISTCFARKLKSIPVSAIVYLQAIGGTAIGFIGGISLNSLYLPTYLSDVQLVALIFAGILGFLARGCFTFACQTEDATKISVVQAMEIPFSFIVQLVMLNTYPNSLSVIGAVIVTIGTTLLVGKKNLKQNMLKISESFRNRTRPKTIKKRYVDEEQGPLIVDTTTASANTLSNKHYGTKQ